ncbi:MAG: CHASE2 domain-containing protein [Candidatus Omnitrophota bacterium]
MRAEYPTWLRRHIAAFIVATTVVLLSNTIGLKRFELGAFDLFFRMRGAQSYSDKIIIIEIDDQNIEKVGRWPWEMKWHATLALILKSFGAEQVFFDMIFSEPSTEENDAAFSKAIEESDNAYLPFVFTRRSVRRDSAVSPLERFSAKAKGVGSINIYPDADGVLRRIPLFFITESNIYYHMALKMAIDYMGLTVTNFMSDSLTLSNGHKTISIPMLDNNKMLINWVGRWGETFLHYSFLEVINAYKAIKDGEPPNIDVRRFKDSICLVSVTAVGLYDIKPTPLEPEYPGIGVLATAIDNMLGERFIKFPPTWIAWMLIYLMAFIPAKLFSERKTLRENMMTLLIAPIFFMVSFLFFKGSIWIYYFLPILSFVITYTVVSVLSFLSISLEKQHYFRISLVDDLTKLYNKRYLRIVLDTECHLAQIELDRKFCVLMADIDDFKRINDTYGHRTGDTILQEVSDVIKKTVRVSDIVARYGGEEILIVLRGSALSTGVITADKVRKNVEDLVIKEGDNAIKVTASIGVASYLESDNADTLIRRADAGLYKAKKSGKNKVLTVEGFRRHDV